MLTFLVHFIKTYDQFKYAYAIREKIGILIIYLKYNFKRKFLANENVKYFRLFLESDYIIKLVVLRILDKFECIRKESKV